MPDNTNNIAAEIEQHLNENADDLQLNTSPVDATERANVTLPEPKSINPNVPITALPDNKEKLHATLESRIYNMIGSELLEKEYKPSAYAEAVMQSAGDEHAVLYNYAKIRYNDLYATATRRLKRTSELRNQVQ